MEKEINEFKKEIDFEGAVIALSKGGLSLEYIMIANFSFTVEEFQKLYEIAIRQNGQALEFVPKIMRTPELCKLAVENTGRAMWQVPLEYRTQELMKIAVGTVGKAIKTNVIVHDELYEIAVKKDGMALKYIPEDRKTRKICKLAVENNGSALEFVPDHMKDLKLCELAVQESAHAIEWLPEDKKNDRKLLEKARIMSGFDLDQIPSFFKDEDFWRKTLFSCKDPMNLLWKIPKEILTLDLCQQLFQKRPDLFEKSNKDFLIFLSITYRNI